MAANEVEATFAVLWQAHESVEPLHGLLLIGAAIVSSSSDGYEPSVAVFAVPRFGLTSRKENPPAR